MILVTPLFLAKHHDEGGAIIMEFQRRPRRWNVDEDDTMFFTIESPILGIRELDLIQAVCSKMSKIEEAMLQTGDLHRSRVCLSALTKGFQTQATAR